MTCQLTHTSASMWACCHTSWTRTCHCGLWNVWLPLTAKLITLENTPLYSTTCHLELCTTAQRPPSTLIPRTLWHTKVPTNGLSKKPGSTVTFWILRGILMLLPHIHMDPKIKSKEKWETNLLMLTARAMWNLSRDSLNLCPSQPKPAHMITRYAMPPKLFQKLTRLALLQVIPVAVRP